MRSKARTWSASRPTCGEDGLELAKLYDFDIIVLDLRLPDIDGYEVVRRLRAARVQTPMLILSGRSRPDRQGARVWSAAPTTI